MNKNIIIAILAIVVIAAAAFMFFSQPADGKLNTQINFLSGTSLQNGDQVQFELKDAQGNALAGQNVTISYDDRSGNIQTYKIITDSNGKGYLTINGEDAGDYDITVTFDENDQYHGCSAKQTITITEGTSDAQETVEENSTANTVMYNNNTQSSSSGSAPSQTYYDAELNVYYDANGNIIGGQDAGGNIYELRNRMNNPDMVDAEGNLQ